MSAPALRRSLFSALPRLTPLRPSTLQPARRWASDDAPADAAAAPPPPPAAKKPVSTPMADIANLLQSTSPRAPRSTGGFPASLSASAEDANRPVTVNHDFEPSAGFDLQSLTAVPSLSADEEYHLHIYSTKHNTHITFTRPDRGAIVSVSAGNIGFRKSHRGTYDAAYQLAAHVFKTIDDKKVKPRAIEVILRGFGQGREAVVKALLGQEGKNLRNAIRRVTDSTRLKFGGTRSKAPRRLG